MSNDSDDALDALYAEAREVRAPNLLRARVLGDIETRSPGTAIGARVLAAAVGAAAIAVCAFSFGDRSGNAASPRRALARIAAESPASLALDDFAWSPSARLLITIATEDRR